MIELAPITQENFRRVIAMELPQSQKSFVASNVYSIAQAYLYPEARPFALMDGGEIVGFLMLDWDEEGRDLGIWRLMIAPEHQNKGFGRQTLQAVLAMARETGLFDTVNLDVVPENTVAKALYESFGFRETGEVEDGEIVMARTL